MATGSSPDIHSAETQRTSLESQPSLDTRFVLLRAVVFAGLWWLFSDGSLSSWIVGAPTVAAAVYTSVVLRPTTSVHVSFGGSLRFLVMFLRESVRGGTAVALRAFQPRLSFAPLLVYYPVRLPEGSVRILFANTVSLLPGTLSAMFHNDHLTVHALDGDPKDIIEELRALEQTVADFYGITLSTPEPFREASRV